MKRKSGLGSGTTRRIFLITKAKEVKSVSTYLVLRFLRILADSEQEDDALMASSMGAIAPTVVVFSESHKNSSGTTKDLKKAFLVNPVIVRSSHRYLTRR